MEFKTVSEFEELGRSSWESTTANSTWHFNTKCPATLGKDSYTPVCIFDMDFTNIIHECLLNAKIPTWDITTDDYKHERAFRSQGGISTTVVTGIPMFRKISDYLGLVNPKIKFINQTTGQMLYYHTDSLGSHLLNTDNVSATVRRFAVMLADWEMGQAWMFGNALYHQWTAGTCITWEWQDMPHATVNAGWEPRPMLQITGIETARTLEIVRNAELNLNSALQKISL